jgi:hypothetical protein
MVSHAAPQFTPTQLIDAGRRAEAEGRLDLAVQFYRHVTENFAEAAQAAEAHGALGRIGHWQSSSPAGPQAGAYQPLRRRPGRGRDRYAVGRALTRIFDMIGWLVALGGPAAIAAWLFLGAEDAGLPRLEVLSLAGSAAGSLILGLGIALAAHVARALFDQASAARDLLALVRDRSSGVSDQ